MFYDLVLLRRQNQGRFAMAWIASTRGIKSAIKKFGFRTIRDTNICTLSDETMELLTSNSTNPRDRISLRMAVFLIQGISIIFHKQVSIFQDDLYQYYTIISKFPTEISSPKRKMDATQRMFKTPPTPVVKEKIKRKRVPTKPEAERLLDEYLRTAMEGADEASIKAPGVPTEVETSKERLSILEVHSLQVALPDDVFGEFDVGPTTSAPSLIPPKPPSEISEKSQLEKIEEILIHEHGQQKEEDKDKKSEKKKSSKSIVTEESPEQIAKKAKTVGKGSSSSSGPEGPVTIMAEVTVHRAQEIEEVKEVRPSVQPPPPELAIIESAVTDQIQPQQEIVSVPEQHPEKEITSIPEQAPKKVIADIQEKEKSKEEEIQSILEKAVIPKKRKSLRQLQADEIEEQRRIPERRMSKEERERGKKEEKIALLLSLKFRTRRVLHLDNYSIQAVPKDISMTIFEETKILCDDLANFLILPIGEEFIAFQTEQMRKEGSSSQTGSELIGRQSKFLTPVDTLLKSTPQIESLLVPRTSDSAPEFNVQHYQISTPLRTDDVLMQQKNLYEETVIEYIAPAADAVEKPRERIVSSLEKEPQIHEKSPSLKIKRDKKRKSEILQTIKDWDENQGYILVDDLIQFPKNKLNAAKTFLFLLELTKEEYICLIPEEGFLNVKYAKKGKLLL